jgi:GH25 family lysozyme M1 (1,4-beta-N-acetylmuramidase)
MGEARTHPGRPPAVAIGLVTAILLLTTSSLGARDIGVDVSHFQGETGMPQANWNQLASEGRTFAFIKSTEGLNPPGNIDAAWPTNVQRASDAGILNGVYHFARPDNRPTVAGAVQEADFFVATAGSAMTPGHLRPVIDVERIGATQTAADLSNWVNAFVNEVVALKGAEAEPIVYTTSGFATSNFNSSVSSLDLWIRANFGDPQTGQPSTTGVFSNWAFWQYNVGPAGGIGTIDQNVVHTEFAPLSSYVITPEPASAGTLAVAAAAIALTRRHRRGRARRRSLSSAA